MRRKKLNPDTLMQMGAVLQNRQAFLRDIEDHLNHHHFLSVEDFKRIQSRYSPKRRV